MFGIFVNETGHIPYAVAIVSGFKPIETRNRNTLKSLVGKRVAIVRTHRNKKPMIFGYVTISFCDFRSEKWLDNHRDLTLIPPGSMYDCKGKGKYCYYLSRPEKCEPYELPKNAVRHGFSY